MKQTGKLALLAALMTIAYGSAQAQTTQRGDFAEAKKELRDAIKSWAQVNVLPQLRQWKSKLDGAMSSSDLQTLNELRSRASVLRKEAMERGRAMREAWKSEDYESLKKQREALKELKSKRKELIEELKPLAIAYRSTLEEIGAEAKPKAESWKEEGRGIVEKWIAEHRDEIGDRKIPHLKGGLGWFRGIDKGMRKKVMVARFMLWDGEDFIEKFGDEGGAMDDGEFDLK